MTFVLKASYIEAYSKVFYGTIRQMAKKPKNDQEVWATYGDKRQRSKARKLIDTHCVEMVWFSVLEKYADCNMGDISQDQIDEFAMTVSGDPMVYIWKDKEWRNEMDSWMYIYNSKKYNY